METTWAGRGHTISVYNRQRTQYGQYLFSCPLPPLFNRPPSHLSVVSMPCSNSSVLLRVLVPPGYSTRFHNNRTVTESGSYEYEFATCTAPSFGNVRPEIVVEWIEANRIFGVTLFNIYNGGITSNDTLRVLQSYSEATQEEEAKDDDDGRRRSAVVRVVNLLAPVDAVGARDRYEAMKMTSTTAFNDCLMTNMYRARYLIVVDFDELIVPRGDAATLKKSSHRRSGTAEFDSRQPLYRHMLTTIDRRVGRKTSAHSYIFRNTYFFRHFPADKRQPKYLTTMRY